MLIRKPTATAKGATRGVLALIALLLMLASSEGFASSCNEMDWAAALADRVVRGNVVSIRTNGPSDLENLPLEIVVEENGAEVSVVSSSDDRVLQIASGEPVLMFVWRTPAGTGYPFSLLHARVPAIWIDRGAKLDATCVDRTAARRRLSAQFPVRRCAEARRLVAGLSSPGYRRYLSDIVKRTGDLEFASCVADQIAQRGAIHFNSFVFPKSGHRVWQEARTTGRMVQHLLPWLTGIPQTAHARDEADVEPIRLVWRAVIAEAQSGARSQTPAE